MTVNYPGAKSWYTMDTGFFSLNGASNVLNYTSVNGSSITLNQTLPVSYEDGAIPSISYGLHIGSASPNYTVPGSLVLGGYDRSRCLTEPIVSSEQYFTLTDITLGVAEGGSPFPKVEVLPSDSFLRPNGTSVDHLNAYVNPGVPYFHLPQDTCSAIAENLPVTFDESLGLYLWNTSDPAFHEIVSSPSYLSFNFSTGSSSSSSIKVPFALLNLTLETPLVSTPTQYFPCSPYAPSDGSTFHLGRAFLQAAFLAQNWQTQRIMLAQAPGPGAASQQITTIASTDTNVTPSVNAPSWYSTWSSKLSPLSTQSSNSTTTVTPASRKKHSLSGGAIAGIVIGIVVLIAVIVILALILRGRKKRSPTEELNKHPIATYYKDEAPIYEAAGQSSRNELAVNQRAEFPANDAHKDAGRFHEEDSQEGSLKQWPVELDSGTSIGELHADGSNIDDVRHG
ncbi:hypothetical protein MBLNU459_g5270t2 [Dothideomycetes sp. NU459]